MAGTVFVEELSQDPVERALARRVRRILMDATLTRTRRVELVQRAQRELLEHRRRPAPMLSLKPMGRRKVRRPADPLFTRRREMQRLRLKA